MIWCYRKFLARPSPRPVFPCLSPRRGEVSRSNGEGAIVRHLLPLSGAARQLSPRQGRGRAKSQALRASSPLAQGRGRAKSQALRANSPLAQARGRAKDTHVISAQVLSYLLLHKQRQIHDLLPNC